MGYFLSKKFFIENQQVRILGVKIIDKKLVFLVYSTYLYYVIKIKNMSSFMRNLGIVVGSHINDAMIEVSFNPELSTKRMKFIKALTFFNQNLELSVTDDYLNWLWSELDNGSWGGKYESNIDYSTLKK
jgi:hypothetical protein